MTWTGPTGRPYLSPPGNYDLTEQTCTGQDIGPGTDIDPDPPPF